MKPFQLNIPTRVYFGAGITPEAFEKEKKLLDGDIIVVTTGYSNGALARHGHIDALIKTLREVKGGGEIILFSGVSPDPRLDEAEEGARIARERGVSAVIGFGGGSAMDAAKAVAVGAGTGEPLKDYLLNGKEPPMETLPVIAVPTTSGSGSELSMGAILTCTVTGVKTGIRGERISPRASVVDPVYTYTLPYKTTMESGFDVIAHAAESYISRKANTFTRMLSEQALSLASESLPALAGDLSCREARDNMSYASMIMGINLSNAGTLLPHRMQYPIGVSTGTSHGAGLAALYMAWIDCGFEYSKDDFNRIGSLVGGVDCFSRGDVLDVFRGLLQKLGLPLSLREFLKGDDADIGKMESGLTGKLDNDPAFAREGIVNEIYRKSIRGW